MENKKIGKLVLSLALPAVIGAGMATVSAGEIDDGSSKAEEVTSEVITTDEAATTIIEDLTTEEAVVEKTETKTEEVKEETKVEEKKEEEEISDPIQGTKVYVVNFDTNGGQGVFKDISTGEISVTRKYGSVVLPKNKPTREGYTFVEWNSERDGSGAISGREGQRIMIDKNYTLYARWAKNAVRTVSFDANGGNTTPANIVTDENGIFVLPDAVNKDGYIFDGWNTKADGSGYWGNANQRMFISASDTVYAIYRDLSEQANLDQDQEVLASSSNRGIFDSIGNVFSKIKNSTDNLFGGGDKNDKANNANNNANNTNNNINNSNTGNNTTSKTIYVAPPSNYTSTSGNTITVKHNTYNTNNTNSTNNISNVNNSINVNNSTSSKTSNTSNNKAEEALARINEIRAEAKKEGIKSLWGNNDNYWNVAAVANGIPLKWSNSAIKFADTRAKEQLIKEGHDRPNGQSSVGGVKYGNIKNLENLASWWPYTLDMLYAVNSWYGEKKDYLDHIDYLNGKRSKDTNKPWGHYNTMIMNLWDSVGLGFFHSNDKRSSSGFNTFVAAEFVRTPENDKLSKYTL